MLRLTELKLPLDHAEGAVEGRILEKVLLWLHGRSL